MGEWRRASPGEAIGTTALNAIGQREAQRPGNALERNGPLDALAADWQRPIYEKIRTGLMAGGYLQIHETPIRYLSSRPSPYTKLGHPG